MTQGKIVEAAEAHKTLEDFDPPKKRKRNKYAFACAVLASMTSILLGYGESYEYIHSYLSCSTCNFF